MVMALMIPIFSFTQCCFRPLGCSARSIYPVLDGRATQLLENNWISLLEHFDKIPRAHIPPNRGMLHCSVDLAPQERAKPVVVYGFACLVFSRSSFVLFLLTDTFFLRAFRARKLCNAMFVSFVGLVFKFYKYTLK